MNALKKLDETTKKTILDEVQKNEDLLFQWTMVSADADDSVGTEILNRISTLYLTVRGFAFATSCLEMYKQRHKKTHAEIKSSSEGSSRFQN